MQPTIRECNEVKITTIFKMVGYVRPHLGDAGLKMRGIFKCLPIHSLRIELGPGDIEKS